VKNVGTTDLAHSPVPVPHGLLTGGDQAQELDVLGNFDQCDDFPHTQVFGPGRSYKSCAPVLVKKGSTLLGVSWSTDPFSDSPQATWTP
jgi:hypothetical protein